MRNFAGAIALFLAATALVFGQQATCNTATIPLCTQGTAGADVQVKPQAVPTSTTIITAFDAYLQSVTISNPTAGAITVTLCDRQAVPVCVVGAVSIGANTTYILTWAAKNPESHAGLYWCPLGFTLTSSGAGLTFYAGWLQ